MTKTEKIKILSDAIREVLNHGSGADQTGLIDALAQVEQPDNFDEIKEFDPAEGIRYVVEFRTFSSSGEMTGKAMKTINAKDLYLYMKDSIMTGSQYRVSVIGVDTTEIDEYIQKDYFG